MGPYGGTSAPEGTYFVELDGYRYTFTVSTEAWWSNHYPGFVAIGKVHGDTSSMTRLFLTSGDGGEVFADACQWSGTNASPGATVDDLLAAMAAVHGFESSELSDTTVGGYRGKHLRLTVPTDVRLADCDGGQYHGLDGFYDIRPGQVQDFWIFEADGSRHVFWSAYEGGAPAEAQADLTQLINSLQIEKVAPTPS
jgi:hypothetical protein